MNKTIATLPHDVEAEKVILSSVLVDADPSMPSLSAMLNMGIRHDVFYEPKHQTIFNACQTLHANKTIPDELTIANQLRQDGFLDLSGGTFYLNDLTSKVFAPSPNILPAAKIVLGKYHDRTIIKICNDTMEKAVSGSFTPSELADAFNAQVKSKLTNIQTGETTQRMCLDDLRRFDRHNDPNNLIGRRWLCRGGSLLFSGQAGSGKSSLITQLTISWALGKDIWGIKPVRPMRIVILQSENDLGDLSEQWTDVCNALKITHTEHQLLDERVWIYREAVKTGEAFGQLIEHLVTTHNADILLVDPLLGFAGGDVSKQEFCSHFLRHILQPCLMRTGCALVAVHHQNKPPKKKEDQQSMSSTYDFTGSSELANWFRSTAILRREDADLPNFVFKLGKRGNRAGMIGHDGQYTESLRIRHSKVRGEICWERNTTPMADNDQI